MRRAEIEASRQQYRARREQETKKAEKLSPPAAQFSEVLNEACRRFKTGLILRTAGSYFGNAYREDIAQLLYIPYS